MRFRAELMKTDSSPEFNALIDAVCADCEVMWDEVTSEDQRERKYSLMQT